MSVWMLNICRRTNFIQSLQRLSSSSENVTNSCHNVIAFHLALQRNPKIAVWGVFLTETALSQLVTQDSIKQLQHKFLLRSQKSRQEITLTFKFLSRIYNQTTADNASSEVHGKHTNTCCDYKPALFLLRPGIAWYRITNGFFLVHV